MIKLLCLAGFSALSLGCAEALAFDSPYGGSYTVTTPGQPSTFVNRNPSGGGYTINTPGQPSIFADPNPIGGGYMVTTPGRPTTFINPNPLSR
jgi:hypothetical protein